MKKTGKGRLGLAAVLAALALTACGKGDAAKEGSQWVWAPEFITTEDSLYGGELVGDSIYSVSYMEQQMTPAEGDASEDVQGPVYIQCIRKYSLTDRKTENYPIAWPEGEEGYGIQKSAFTGDGGMWAVVYAYSDNWENRTYRLMKFSAEGQGLPSRDITDQVKGGYIDNMAVDSEGRVYIATEEAFLLYDAEGNMQASLNMSEITGGSWVRGICQGKDGKVYLDYQVQDGTGANSCLAEVDFGGRKIGTVYKNLPMHNVIAAGGEWDFLLSDETDVYGYRLETQEQEKLFTWLDSDIDGNSVTAFGMLEDGRMAAVISSYATNYNAVALLTKTTADKAVQKETIRIGTLYNAYSLQSVAADFNRNSDKYRISVKQYIDYNNYGENTWADALASLNNDLTSANCPDILDLAGVNIEALAAKGLFEDMGQYLDKSSTLNRSDFLENILAAYTLNGRLLGIPKSFTLRTIAGSAIDLGTEPGWTLEELMAYADRHPDKELFDGMSKENMMYTLMSYNKSAFIDWSTGECKFDSDVFKSLLKFVNRFPEDAKYGDPALLRIQNKEVLLYDANLYQFESVQEAIDAYEGKALWVGIPTVDGKAAHALYAEQVYAITSKSKNKEGAWAFLETFLNLKNDRYSMGFPTKKADLEKMREEATDLYYRNDDGSPMLDGEGNPILRESYNSIGYMSEDGTEWNFTYHIVTQEEADMVMSMMENAKVVSYNGDDEIMKIISEEAGAFYKGQKSVDEVATIIQGRVKMYVETNR